MLNTLFTNESLVGQASDLETAIEDTKRLELHQKQNSDLFLTHSVIYGLGFLGFAYNGSTIANNDPRAELILGIMAIKLGFEAIQSIRNHLEHARQFYSLREDRLSYEREHEYFERLKDSNGFIRPSL